MRRLQVPALRLQILRPGLRLPREIGWRHWPGLAGPVCRGFLNLAAAQADRRGHRLDVFAHALGQPPPSRITDCTSGPYSPGNAARTATTASGSTSARLPSGRVSGAAKMEVPSSLPPSMALMRTT